MFRLFQGIIKQSIGGKMSEEVQYMHRQLPNGDIIRVVVPDDYTDEMLLAQTRMKDATSVQIAGGTGCPHCGITYASPGVLDEHIKMNHMLAAGKADMRQVELPDGTSVPVALIPDLIEAQKTEADETIESLKQELADLREYVRGQESEKKTEVKKVKPVKKKK